MTVDGAIVDSSSGKAPRESLADLAGKTLAFDVKVVSVAPPKSKIILP